MIAETSKLAYICMEDLETRRATVLSYIRRNPDQCAEQIMKGLGARSPNSVAPRITELLHDTKDIFVSGRTATSSGCTARTYRAYPPDTPPDMKHTGAYL